jgi:hypothetical protein
VKAILGPLICPQYYHLILDYANIANIENNCLKGIGCSLYTGLMRGKIERDKGERQDIIEQRHEKKTWRIWYTLKLESRSRVIT